jgi:predicted N-acetyltransferase YhbS
MRPNKKNLQSGGKMETRYVTAEAGDYDELMDFSNYVFSHAHGPTDFPGLLPKLYRREYFMEGTHYLAREGGRIRAAVGAYPLTLNVLGEALPGRGIGMVSVHPYARSRGYMRALMGMALADMRRDGIVFSCLGGQRQRYEYFGFTPAGTRIVFECRRANIRHFLGKDASPALSLRRLNAGDAELEDVYRAHQSKAARFERDRGKFFDILSSWKNRAFVLLDENRFAGYLIYNGAENTENAENAENAENIIEEINLADSGRAAEALACFLRYFEGKDRVSVAVQPWETAKLKAFAAFAEDYHITTAYSFAVFDWRPFLSALLRLKGADDGNGGGPARPLPDREAAFRIAGGSAGSREYCFRIAVKNGGARALPDSGEGAITLDPLRAARFFFSPLSPWASPAPRQNPFLRDILPLPLFFESPDGV